MSQVNAKIPDKTTAGLNFTACVTACGYQSPTWSVSLVLRGPQAIDLDADGDGSEFTFSVDAATTAAWADGLYAYSLRATNGTDKVELQAGQLTVLADLAAVTNPYDSRSDNEKALEAIQAVINKRATLDQERYRINNRELWRTPIADLLKLLTFYKNAVRQERNKARGVSTFGRPIHVKFSQR